MALDQDDRQLNTDAQPQDARPEDPDKTTKRRSAGGSARQDHGPGTGTATFGSQPRGNGDQDERDTEKGRDKLDSVLGQ